MASDARMGVKRKLVNGYNPATSKLSREEREQLLTDANLQLLWSRALELDEKCCLELKASALEGRYQTIIAFFNHPLLREAWNPKSFMAYFVRIATECMNHSALISDRGFIQNIADSLTDFSGSRVPLTAEMFWFMFLHSSHNLVTLNELYKSLIPGQWDRVLSILFVPAKTLSKSFPYLLSQVICNLLVARANRYQHSWLSSRLKTHINTSDSTEVKHLDSLNVWLQTSLPSLRNIKAPIAPVEVKGMSSSAAPVPPFVPVPVPESMRRELEESYKAALLDVPRPPSEIGSARRSIGPGVSESVGESEEEDDEESVAESDSTNLRMYRGYKGEKLPSGRLLRPRARVDDE